MGHTAPSPGSRLTEARPHRTTRTGGLPLHFQAMSVSLGTKHAVPGFQLNPVMVGDMTARDNPAHEIVVGVPPRDVRASCRSRARRTPAPLPPFPEALGCTVRGAGVSAPFGSRMRPREGRRVLSRWRSSEQPQPTAPHLTSRILLRELSPPPCE